MNLNNTVIKAIDSEQGKQIIQFFKLNGINVYHFDGKAAGAYYGVVNNIFDCWTPIEMKMKQRTTPINIIELPEEYLIPEVPIGKLMYVSNSPFDMDNLHLYNKKFVVGKRKNYYYAWQNAINENEIKVESGIYGWKYAMFIPDTNPKKEQLLNKIDELKTQIKELEKQVENF